jgi:hypothetical protein
VVSGAESSLPPVNRREPSGLAVRSPSCTAKAAQAKRGNLPAPALRSPLLREHTGGSCESRTPAVQLADERQEAGGGKSAGLSRRCSRSAGRVGREARALCPLTRRSASQARPLPQFLQCQTSLAWGGIPGRPPSQTARWGSRHVSHPQDGDEGCEVRALLPQPGGFEGFIRVEVRPKFESPCRSCTRSRRRSATRSRLHSLCHASGWCR